MPLREGLGVNDRALDWLLFVVIGLAIFPLFYDLNGLFLSVDFDMAIDATYVNNMSFRESYNHMYRVPETFHERAWSWYAAHRIPISLPLSLLQRLLGIPYYYVDTFLIGLSGLFAVVGSYFAANVLVGRRRGFEYVALIVGGASLFPGLYLYARTGFFFWFFIYAGFWWFLWLVHRYVQTDQPVYLYGSGFLLAYLAMNPYPPILVLPFLAIALLLVYRKFAQTMGSRHVYLAGLCAGLVFVVGHVGTGLAYEGSVSEYWEKVSAFRSVRSGMVSVKKQLMRGVLSEKLTKYTHQHVAFGRDDLGDHSRDDSLWTPDRPLFTWIFCFFVFILGVLLGVWRGERDAYMTGIIVFVTLGFFFSISFPEGRYIIVLVPCYFAGVVYFLRSAVRLREVRVLAVVAILISFGSESLWAINKEHVSFVNPYLAHRQLFRPIAIVMNGMEVDSESKWAMGMIPHRFDQLVWQMYSNFGPQLVSPSDVLGEVAAKGEGIKVPYFLVLSNQRSKLAVEAKKLGFKRVKVPAFKGKARLFVYNPNLNKIVL